MGGGGRIRVTRNVEGGIRDVDSLAGSCGIVLKLMAGFLDLDSE